MSCSDGFTGTADVEEDNGPTLARATVSPRPPAHPLSNPTTTAALNTTPHRASPPSVTHTQPTTVPLPRPIKTERREPFADETARQPCHSAAPHMASSPVLNSSTLASVRSPSSLAPGGTQDETAPAQGTRGDDSDDSLECLDPSSSLEVIDIDEWDHEVSNPSAAPQRGVSVRPSCATDQTQTQRFKAENSDRSVPSRGCMCLRAG